MVLVALPVAIILLRYRISPNRRSVLTVGEGDVDIPEESDIPWRDSSRLTRLLIDHYASLDLPDWKKEGKVKAPRIILAKLQKGIDVDAVNDYLLSKKPWGAPGSTWPLHPRGDYDFTMMALAAVLHLFHGSGDPLRDETARHIAVRLIGIDDPTKRCDRVPNTFGLILESENHVLMTTGSRYLALKWAKENGVEIDDNSLELLGNRVKHLLEELYNPGPYEFNSDPYFGYTLTAVLILEAFGYDDVKEIAEKVLYRLNYNYALSSMGLRRAPPFRRQVKRACKTSLVKDYHSSMMEVWRSLFIEEEAESMISGGHEHSLMAAVLPYRPHAGIMTMLDIKDREYLFRIGNGKGSSPEIYSGGPGFLISSGGTPRSLISRIAARPSILLLDDGETDMEHVLRLSGPRCYWWKWNNTGVHRRFAVSSCPARVPSSWIPCRSNDLWRVYLRSGITIGVHSGNKLGIICILDGDPDEAFNIMNGQNGDVNRLRREFVFPDGRKVSYDVSSPKDKGVITAVDGGDIDRDLDDWTLLSGNFL
ncbi:MAG: hypothetical protein ACMUIG_05895 [Thermoplasmatota archaeon]